jgi:hypothetical protein
MGDNPIQVDVAWFKRSIQKDEQCWQQLKLRLHYGEPKHVAQKCSNKKIHKVWSIVLGEENIKWKMNLSNFNRDLFVGQQYLKGNKRSISTSRLCICFMVLTYTHIAKWIIHVKALIVNGAITYSIAQDFGWQKYL